ncbi:MAG TPA: ankyrin repeat domain-containing protein, partial [Candidatus Eremiobacteraeota bacterium]|nr:ankyrin repeat domain-containing protein [Candidatus Eremiobacteraeota bacterium]
NILPVIEDKKIRIAELLLSEGANINAKDIDGETPFHWLSWNGSYKLLAHMLITEGADINAKNNFGATPLNLAIWNKKKKFVEFLKSMGAKENTHINKILTYRELNLQLAACGRNLSNIATAIELYCNDNKGLYPPTLEYLTGLDKSYLEVIPVCPACEKKLYIYEKSDNPANFTLQCGETNIHFKTGKVDEGNYPRYSPSEGLKFKN